LENHFFQQIAQELAIKFDQVKTAVELLDNDNTIPFIARYRKEATGSLNEIELRQIEKKIHYLRNLHERKQEVLESIEKQGKLTDELREKILAATQLVEVEDLYLPYRPKRRTKGMMGKEKGLEPLADMILAQQVTTGKIDDYFTPYLSEEHDLKTIVDVKIWTLYVIAEKISEIAEVRDQIRQLMYKTGIIHSLKYSDSEEPTEFEMYYDYEENISHIPPHRILAINRGENKDVLKVKIEVPTDQMVEEIGSFVVKNFNCIFVPFIFECIEDAYKRLIFPSIEKEIRNSLTEKAELHAIKIFGTNLKNLLLQPPVNNKVIMGVDPGFRTGCKVAVVNKFGEYLEGTTIFPTPPFNKTEESEKIICKLIDQHQVEVIAIGNGTASRETETFIAHTIKKVGRKVMYLIVSEAGASVYSASEVAIEEFPELDASMRGNISIARRVVDPLSELVKIDPKSIGVGLYQHDVNQKELASELTEIVKHCVNYVGVDVNSASASLLQYVSGITRRVAKNIVEYRKQKGTFKDRKQLMEVKGMGEHAFEQSAGFLKIPEGNNPLDNTTIHPESYPALNKLFNHFQLPIKDLVQSYSILKLKMKTAKKKKEKIAEMIEIGLPTLEDIFENLEKPGRDPRDQLPKPMLREDVLKIEDLKEGMLIDGTVRNVVDFGAFVDIGIKREGLLHKSQISNTFLKHPTDALSVGDIIKVKVISVDTDKGRVSLSLKY